jgi:hypothetical protein
MAAKCIDDGRPTRTGLTSEETRYLVLFLQALLNLDRVTTALAKAMNLQRLLRVVLNTTQDALRFKWPAEAVEVAQLAFTASRVKAGA